MGGTGSESCLMARFGISGVGTSGFSYQSWLVS